MDGLIRHKKFKFCNSESRTMCDAIKQIFLKKICKGWVLSVCMTLECPLCPQMWDNLPFFNPSFRFRWRRNTPADLTRQGLRKKAWSEEDRGSVAHKVKVQYRHGAVLKSALRF